MTIKYLCDMCGGEIQHDNNEDHLCTLLLHMPDFDPEVLGHYCPGCSDKITKIIKSTNHKDSSKGEKE
mgnify:CR=1 FL=1